jgi:hypothetical protein
VEDGFFFAVLRSGTVLTSVESPTTTEICKFANGADPLQHPIYVSPCKSSSMF